MRGKLISALGINAEIGSVSIKQAQSEVFTVVNIWEIKNMSEEESASFINIALFSEEKDEYGDYQIIGYRREYV